MSLRSITAYSSPHLQAQNWYKPLEMITRIGHIFLQGPPFIGEQWDGKDHAIGFVARGRFVYLRRFM